MTPQETKSLYRAIKDRYPSFTLHKKVLRKEQSKQRKEARAARNDPMQCIMAVAKLAAVGAAQRGYTACVSIAKDGNLGTVAPMPSSTRLTETANRIVQAATQDLKLYETPDGWAVDLRSTIELAVHQHESTPLPIPRDSTGASEKKTRPEATIPPRSLSACKETRKSEIIVGLRFDARVVSKSPQLHDTEAAINIMDEGPVCVLLSQMVLRIKHSGVEKAPRNG